MQRPSREDIESYSKKDLVEFTETLLEDLDYSSYLINQLEKKLEVALNELGSKNQRVLDIIEQIDHLKQRMFARSSERSTGDDGIFAGQNDKDIAETAKPSDPSKGSSKPKRKKAEDRVTCDAPVNDIYHYATDEEISDLKLREWKNQFETSELISVIPTTIQIDRHHRQKYRYTEKASGQPKFFTAKGPIKLRDGAQYSIEFTSHIAANKYCYHLPLDRQATMLKSKGLEISTSSLSSQVHFAAFTLQKSVFKPITHYLQKSPFVEADDTTWPNLEDLKTRKQDKYYLWGMKNDKAVAFNIFNARSQKVAKDFLGKQQGILLSDGHNSFEALVSKHLILASDWAHTRRYFKKAEKFYPDESRPILDLINKLFGIEAKIKGKPPDDIIKERLNQSKPVLEELSKLLDSTPYLKTSSLGKAISYTKRLWDRLIVFLHHGELPISTNGIERSMRTPALGRNNHRGSKNMDTAKNAAIWYTIVETCKLNQVNVEAYITYALATTLKGQTPKLPWEYSA